MEDILIIVICTVLCGLDMLGDLVIYARNKKEFLTKEFGIEEIPSKATFARVLSILD
ncbi:MAG: transposase family protein [Angelakisella sp.]|nr:transposase family protein [Angelakisella sp.]